MEKSVEENALNGKEYNVGTIKANDWIKNEVQELIKTAQKTITILQNNIERLKPYKSQEANELIQEMQNLSGSLQEMIVEKEMIRDKIIPEQSKNELQKDYDGDGVSNYEELQNGTNIYERDSDHDGIDDKYDQYKDYDDNELER